MPAPSPTALIALAAAATLVLWASGFAGNRAALVDLSPGELSLYRYGVASLALAAIAVFKPPVAPRLADLWRLGLTGALGIGIYNLALASGQRTVSAGSASFIVNTAPIFSALLAWPMLGERPAPWGWAGLLVSLAGVALIALGEGSGSFSWGALEVFVAALAWALYHLVQKPLLPRYGALGVVSYAIWGGTLMFLVFIPDLLAKLPTLPVRTHAVAVYLGVLPGALAFVLWSFVLTHLPVTRATALLYLVPALALAIAWLALGERPGALAVAGGVVAIAGVAIGRIRPAVAPAEAKPA
jgi:drug/metabolite transporter (DMT)-like permease